LGRHFSWCSSRHYVGAVAVYHNDNDLKINDSNIWKFVDDTTLDEIVRKNEESKVQTLIFFIAHIL
jgi:hypothetical protein